jgi:hypothetical protein
MSYIDEDLLRFYLEELVDLAPRYTGTYGCEKSADFIYQQFQSMNLDSEQQQWTSYGNEYHRRWFKSENVIGTHKSENADDATIIFGAHYDTVRFTPGANDDGSGTAAVLAAAYALSHFEFNHTLKFITFSGEEVGLLGSRAYAKRAYETNEEIMLNINADMIGRSTTQEGFERMRFSITEDADWAVDIIEYINYENNLGFQQFERYEIDREGRGYSDYKPFTEYGFEAIACWGGEGDPNMHQPTDTLDNVNFEYLTRMAKIIAGTLAHIDDGENLYPQVRIVSPRFGQLYYEGMKVKNLSDRTIKVIDDIWIWAEVFYNPDPIVRAEFSYDGRVKDIDYNPPFKWNLNTLSLRKHRIKIEIYDEYGRTSSDYKDIYFYNFLRQK